MPIQSEHEAPQDASYMGDPVAFGPQAELCRKTMCCACWVIERHGTLLAGAIEHDWTRLPAGIPPLHYWQRVEAHHEPPRGRALASDDDDTIPLCHHHHQAGAFSRHNVGARVFYRHFGIDWKAVRDEMRRRVSEAR